MFTAMYPIYQKQRAVQAVSTLSDPTPLIKSTKDNAMLKWPFPHQVQSDENVLASAIEAEIGVLINRQKATYVCTILQEMGHKQPPAPIQADNSGATITTNSMSKQTRSRSIVIQFYWVKYCTKQGYFYVF